jgi:hypothetical protein
MILVTGGNERNLNIFEKNRGRKPKKTLSKINHNGSAGKTLHIAAAHQVFLNLYFQPKLSSRLLACCRSITCRSMIPATT